VTAVLCHFPHCQDVGGRFNRFSREVDEGDLVGMGWPNDWLGAAMSAAIYEA
jgi:hypothetical protein